MSNTIKKYFRIAFALSAACITCMAHAQDDSLFRFMKKIEYPISSFAVDNLGELYIINTGNQLKKYDGQGDSIGVFNQVTRYGTLSYVVAQNPWKVILFYKHYATIVLLDKYLNVVTSIDLRNQNIFDVDAVTTSYDNNIWLFDEQDNKLKKVDDNGKILFESTDFRLLFDSVPAPKTILDRDGYVYLYDPDKGLYIFDYYGTFKNKLPFLHWTNISVIDKQVYGFDSTHLYRYAPPLPDVKTFTLSPALQNCTSIQVNNYRVYVLKNQQLNIYSLQ